MLAVIIAGSEDWESGRSPPHFKLSGPRTRKTRSHDSLTTGIHSTHIGPIGTVTSTNIYCNLPLEWKHEIDHLAWQMLEYARPLMIIKSWIGISFSAKAARWPRAIGHGPGTFTPALLLHVVCPHHLIVLRASQHSTEYLERSDCSTSIHLPCLITALNGVAML